MLEGEIRSPTETVQATLGETFQEWNTRYKDGWEKWAGMFSNLSDLKKAIQDDQYKVAVWNNNGADEVNMDLAIEDYGSHIWPSDDAETGPIYLKFTINVYAKKRLNP